MSVSSLDRYTEFLETLPDAVLLVDASGRVAFANSRVHTLLDFEPDELVGRPVSLLTPERYRARCHDLVTGCLAAPAPRRLGEHPAFFGLRRDGREVPLDITMAPQVVDGAATVVCVLRDAAAHHQLRALSALSAALRHADVRAELVGILLEEVMTLPGATGAALVVEIPGEQEMLIEAARGLLSFWAGERVPSEGTITSRVIAFGETFVTDAAAGHPELTRWRLGSRVRSLAVVPARVDGEVFCALAVARDAAFTPGDVALLHAVGEMAAIALQRMAIHEERVRDAAALEDAYEDLLSLCARALDMRERIAEGHSRRVADMTLRLARALGVGPERLPDIRRGALLHDIGKILVPDAVLHKGGPLDEAERAGLRRHPEYAYDLLGASEFLRPALEIPYFHHERWDGTGYPRGLKGEEIPLAARIFAVADAYDVLMSDRSYRLAGTHQAALKHILDRSGRCFDPRVVTAFLEIVDGRASAAPDPQTLDRPV
jgi:PAS domain S-box-containing protein